jgi:hypothetical protein
LFGVRMTTRLLDVVAIIMIESKLFLPTNIVIFYFINKISL